ncbi:MAG: DUF937 domain-containing protein [Aquamicrobium sp.]|uniref:DUF937 domain-containing protein n=1 Tax=Aquamicrobium sp. TaxID=1872579 RepID=UPI00349EB21B|nr:DUF937 domain-containing protein [Aquamicrobium sp.]
MLPLFDMLANAQNGNAIDQMARQFGLSQQQAQEAMAALMPAFSQGLKRNTANPYDLGSFLSALASGQHAKYFEDAAAAFTPQGMQEGNGILGHLFGSKELSRAVAAQAAQATGIAQQTLQQMLPALASMIMGGLFKQSTGQMSAAGFGGQGNPLQEIIEQMMKQGGGFGMPQPAPQQRQAPQQPNPFDNPLGKILEGMFGGGAAQSQPRQRQAPQSPYGDNPLGRIFEEMLGGGQRQAEPAPQSQPRAKPKASPKTNPSGRPRTPYDDLFGDMFEAGAKTRDDYQKNMESVFDQFLQGMEKRGRSR